MDISFEDLNNFYENHSNIQTQKYFNISEYNLKELLNKYNIKMHTKHENTVFTNIEKYGVPNVFQSLDIQERSKNTLIERYGVDNIQKLDATKQKMKQTIFERYGVEYYCQSDDFNNKKHETWHKNYGDDIENPSQAEEVKNKKIETCLDHFGVENPMQDPEICKIALEHQQQTNFEKYGTKYVTQNEEVKSKVVDTNMKKYGVPYYCLHKDCQVNLNNNSKQNKNFEKLLNDSGINNFEREFTLGSYSFDFRINDVLIEINPYPTHNSTWGIKGKAGIDKDYHYKKAEFARENGYKCICIWDWDNKNKIINNLKDKELIYAENCKLKIVNNKDTIEFINKNSLQDYIESKINIGLYYNNELVSIMTFNKNQSNGYKLIEYCSSYNIINGSEKLFNYFKDTYKPNSILYYYDLSKFNNNEFLNLNFKLLNNKMVPIKHWYNPKTLQHIIDDQNINILDEQQMLENNYVEIYDCGHATYIWKNN